MKITYGHHVKDSKDPGLKRLKDMANESSRFDFSVVVLLDWFPFREYGNQSLKYKIKICSDQFNTYQNGYLECF